jgi:hypothetical protein
VKQIVQNGWRYNRIRYIFFLSTKEIGRGYIKQLPVKKNVETMDIF